GSERRPVSLLPNRASTEVPRTAASARAVSTEGCACPRSRELNACRLMPTWRASWSWDQPWPSRRSRSALGGRSAIHPESGLDGPLSSGLDLTGARHLVTDTSLRVLPTGAPTGARHLVTGAARVNSLPGQGAPRAVANAAS